MPLGLTGFRTARACPYRRAVRAQRFFAALIVDAELMGGAAGTGEGDGLAGWWWILAGILLLVHFWHIALGLLALGLIILFVLAVVGMVVQVVSELKREFERGLNNESSSRSSHEELYPGGSTNSPEWKALREQVKARDGYQCRNCGRARLLDVDHIRPLSKGGSNEMANLQTLCRPCHEAKHGRRMPDPRRDRLF